MKQQRLSFLKGRIYLFCQLRPAYYFGNIIKQRENLLVTTAAAFSARYNIDIRLFSEVTEINRLKKEVTVKELKTGRSYTKDMTRSSCHLGQNPLSHQLRASTLKISLASGGARF
jgi:hypothetical protein